MKIVFVGHGYVGLVTAAVFADLGNEVCVIGHTKEKIDNANNGILPIFEPGLEEIVKRNLKKKRIFFTLDYSFVPQADVVFIAVGTPPKNNGEADLSTVFEVAEKIGKNLSGYTVVATKSTVPPGTNRKIKEIIEKVKPEKAEFDIASVPEFLREGSAIADTLNPDRIVIGTESKKAQDLLVALHKPIDGHFILTGLETAEMIKYASNAFLATKISFANVIAKLSELTGADGLAVLEGIGWDKRIGMQFLQPGVGYGGSCFPKDVKALIAIGRNVGYDLGILREVEKINYQMREDLVKKIKAALNQNLKGKTIAILGLAFKPNTDDMRDAPSADVIKALQKAGARIRAYDPQAMENAKKILSNIEFCKDAYEALQGADAMVVVTDWNEFKEMDFDRIKKLLKKPIVIDGRNIYNNKNLKELGFIYQGVGTR